MVSSSENESDGDSVEEFQIKKYMLTSLAEGLQQTKAQIGTRGGLKRQPGHYHLQDRRHAALERKRCPYEGNHWDVDLPYQLQRSTPRLTRYAIKKAVQKEQQERVRREDRKLALRVLKAVTDEFKRVILYNRNRIDMERKRQISDLEETKNVTQWELLRLIFRKQHEEEVEDERKFRMKVLSGLANVSKRTPSIEDLVNGMAEANYKRSLINTDLEEAQANLENNTAETNEDYNVAMSEMLDESLSKVVHTFAATETKHLCEEEKIRRINEMKTQTNPTKKQKTKAEALGELKQVFEDLEAEEAAEAAIEQARVAEMKSIMEEQLIRKVMRTWADQMAAAERARRIQEAEEADLSQNKMRHLVARVQRQMLLQKFKGKWINLVKKPKKEENEEDVVRENETERDRQLRKQRENQRRALGVKIDDD